MFGINSFSQIEDIVEGHYKEFTNQETELYNQRIAICKQCPLYTDVLGGICDSKKCWDTVNHAIVNFPGPNIICACGCRLSAKARLKNAKCVLGKWE